MSNITQKTLLVLGTIGALLYFTTLGNEQKSDDISSQKKEKKQSVEIARKTPSSIRGSLRKNQTNSIKSRSVITDSLGFLDFSLEKIEKSNGSCTQHLTLPAYGKYTIETAIIDGVPQMTGLTFTDNDGEVRKYDDASGIDFLKMIKLNNDVTVGIEGTGSISLSVNDNGKKYDKVVELDGSEKNMITEYSDPEHPTKANKFYTFEEKDSDGLVVVKEERFVDDNGNLKSERYDADLDGNLYLHLADFTDENGNKNKQVNNPDGTMKSLSINRGDGLKDFYEYDNGALVGCMRQKENPDGTVVKDFFTVKDGQFEQDDYREITTPTTTRVNPNGTAEVVPEETRKVYLDGTPIEDDNTSREAHDGELILPSFVPNSNDR